MMMMTMRNGRLQRLVAAVLVAGASGAAATWGVAAQPAGVRERLLGAWELVQIERRGPAGEILNVQKDRIGLIVYDRSGRMIVQHQLATRAPYAGQQPTGDEARAALGSALAYFGTFSVDEQGGFVTHHVQGNVNPSGSGRDEKRFYEFKDDLLILQPPGTTVNGQMQVSKIVWRRVKGR